ncbi:hypothetical protein [Streptomyces sp. CCM_MD2014]|uniref:hypothetical protein n=1 Tax=Streptomyces sp. CCM_MD2014 TaxID=1561022 RepID=UPI00077678B6|nr:hypothetical protein [Streptomyces sp. CCM_MD2014]
MTTSTEPTGAVFKRLETRPLGDLTPYPGNARRGDVGMILESLTASGQFRPLVVREQADGALVVLAGNHTLQAIERHGYGPCGRVTRHDGQERPCALCHGQEWAPTAQVAVYTCTDDTARRIVLADNRTSDAGAYDDQALADLLADMDGDLAGTGYTDDDLEDLLQYLEEDEPEPEPDEDDDQEQEEPAPAGEPATSSAPATGGDTPPPGHASLVLTYRQADKDETSRLIAAAGEVIQGADSAEIILRALRTLVAVIDSRHAPDGVVTVAALLKAADLDQT